MDINLYNPANLALEFIQCSKAEQAGLETLKTTRRAPALIGGVFYARNVAEPPIIFYGGCYWEAGRLIRNLVDGVSNLIATPALRLETEGGIMGELQGGHTMAKRPLIRALGYIPAIPHIYTAPKSHPAPAVHSAF